MTRATVDRRYMQLWFVFTFTDPVRRPASCRACPWRGRRLDPTARPCPRCGGAVTGRPA